ncbi:hypothetical protein [Brevibacillus parabrevis]|uniref:hypothetical protein n=1 Tax=Brevibacillus parabrevis TaxID=54914 RepID=UPI0036F37E26
MSLMIQSGLFLITLLSFILTMTQKKEITTHVLRGHGRPQACLQRSVSTFISNTMTVSMKKTSCLKTARRYFL